MTLPYRQRRCLRRMERALSHSDPSLRAMLSVFTRVHAAERLGGTEQLRTPWPRGAQKLARLAQGILSLLARIAGAAALGGRCILAAARRGCHALAWSARYLRVSRALPLTAPVRGPRMPGPRPDRRGLPPGPHS